MSVIRSQCKSDEEYLLALRDDFAAKAMHGLVASCNNQDRLEGILGFRKISEAAYVAADSMLLAREAK